MNLLTVRRQVIGYETIKKIQSFFRQNSAGAQLFKFFKLFDSYLGDFIEDNPESYSILAIIEEN